MPFGQIAETCWKLYWRPGGNKKTLSRGNNQACCCARRINNKGNKEAEDNPNQEESVSAGVYISVITIAIPTEPKR